MLHLIWICIIGLIAGVVAKLLMPGKDPGGWILTMVLGVAGAFLGTWIGRSIGHYQEGQGAGFLMSVVGAVILLGAYHLANRARA
jgi:uncharacterized membrane protein YeaQ/YmgE (transglycosylase-associated protein family)